MTTDPAISASDRGIKESVKLIDKWLKEAGADHPGDIIADIMHWCDAYNEDFDNLVQNGEDYYAEEIRG